MARDVGTNFPQEAGGVWGWTNCNFSAGLKQAPVLQVLEALLGMPSQSEVVCERRDQYLLFVSWVSWLPSGDNKLAFFLFR